MKKPDNEQKNLSDTQFLQDFKGSFTSALRWHQLDELWQRILQEPQGWFVYAIGEPPPEVAASVDELNDFIREIDVLLRTEHDEKYCGIVYADNPQEPQMVKIYDPNNLGVSCGYSDNPPLPGWLLSRIAPVDLQNNQIIPNNRKRWWQKLFSAK